MRLVHALVGALGAFLLWRALAQGWVSADLPPEAVPTFQLAIPLLSAYASVLAILTRRFRDDALSFAALVALLSIVAAGPMSRDAAGLFFVAAIAIRFAPSIVALVRAERSFVIVFLAAFIYPNTVAAAVIVTAYRLLFTRAHRRVALGGALLATTLLLTPRDAIALVALTPFVGRERRFLVAVAAVALVAIVSNAILYGVPLPYAGYLFGTQAAQTLTGEPSITFPV